MYFENIFDQDYYLRVFCSDTRIFSVIILHTVADRWGKYQEFMLADA